jgi:xanthine dehydrogenase/oxidase
MLLRCLGPRMVHVREFFLGYRKVNLHPHEVLVSVFIPFSTPEQHIQAYKVTIASSHTR